VTVLDRAGPISGLWPGAWAAECGGPRRQKAAAGGFGLGAGEHLDVIVRHNGQWNVMFVQREPGELYLQGSTWLLDPSSHGWVERVDPRTLDTIVRSPDLPSGGHTWCGAAIVGDHGDVVVVNGSFVHRLAHDTLAVVAEREMAANAPHNGIVPLHDGAVLTKDLRLDEPTTVTVLSPDLEVLATLRLPEPSMGRVGADHQSDRTDVYLPGTEHVFRLVWQGGELTMDETWRPRYRGDGGLAWDVCLADDRVWLLDNGDAGFVRSIHRTTPAGIDPYSFTTFVDWEAPMTLTSVAMADARDVATLQLDPSGGFVVAPPTYVPEQRLALVHDVANRRLTAWRFEDGSFEHAWQRDVGMWMQPLVFPDTGELLVDDEVDGVDELALLRLDTGGELGRVVLPDTPPNGMFFTPGWQRDAYACSTNTVSRVVVAPS
jgi:hypothetical protein